MNSEKTANCLHCGKEFVPSRAGHLYHSRECRYAARDDPDRRPVDHKLIERLLDKSRDPEGLVRDDDWHPAVGLENGEKFRELDMWQTLGDRRRWYQTLREEGSV
jgi:hypothetical protein